MSLPNLEYYFVLQVASQADVLIARLVGGEFLRDIERKYQLEAKLLSNCAQALELLLESKQDGLAVEIHITNGEIKFCSESGVAITCALASSSCVEVEATAAEFTKCIEVLRQHEVCQSEENKMLRGKINSAKGISYEAARCIDIKLQAGNKSATTVALYEQQLRLIERLMRELDGS